VPQEASRGDQVEKSPAAMIGLNVDELIDAQHDIFDKVQATNQEWLDRLRAEADLAAEFTQRFIAARSMPEAMTACYDWAGRRAQMMAGDGKRQIAAYERFWETAARLLSNGWQPKARKINK